MARRLVAAALAHSALALSSLAPRLGVGRPLFKAPVRDSFPVVWDDDRTVEKGRRTIRSRFTEFCVRGWVREQVARHRLDAANATVVAAAPETCDFDGAVKGRRRRSTVCADVIHYEGRDVRWFGYARAPTPKLRLSELRAEITNLHTRVLTRGRRGSLRATAVISGADADASSLLHDFLERLVARLLAECGEATAFEFATTVVGDAPGGPRVRMVGKTEDEVAFTVILTLAAENGALALRSPEVWIRGRSTFTVGGLPLPANVLENLAQVYLSTVAVDASARSGAAFAVAEIGPAGPDAVEVRLVSSAASMAAMKRLEKKRREARSALGVEAPTKKAEWRLQVESLFTGAAHPLRHTFVVGERLPWIFNPRTRAPPGVVATFAVLSLIFRVTAVPDNIYRGLGAMRRRVTWTLFRPRLARKYRRGDGLDVAHNRRYSR